MSPSSPANAPKQPRRVPLHRGALVVAAATAALALAVAPAVALPADSTPPPTPPSGSTHPCPTGQTPTQVTAPPRTPARSPSTTTPNPSITTHSDGSVVTTTCAIAPPTPFVGPVISPEHVVGGPKLAQSGIIVDAPTSVPPPPTVSDVSYVISDLATGEILVAKEPHALLLPASTLKTLTSLVILPTLKPTRVVTASHSAANAEGTRVGIIEGNHYTVDQLFTGLVLVSGNDTAYALADAYGGRAKTLTDMNAKAAALGAWDTGAKDPSGLDADGQQSSAYDLSLFGRAVMQLPAFRRYATTRTFTFPGGKDPKGKVHPPFQIANHNTLLENYPGAIGVKNGYTTGARQTFIGAATRGGRTLLISQMGGVGVPSWERTGALLDWTFAHAAQLSPIGTLVAPGAPQPPEWRGQTSTPSTTTTGTTSTGTTSTTSTSTTRAAAASGRTTAPPAIAAPVVAAGSGSTPPPGSSGGNPFPWLLTSASTAARQPLSYAVLAVVGAALASLVSARRRRRRRA